MNKFLTVDAALVLVLLGLGAAGWWWSPYFLPQADVTATPVAGCDLHQGPCRAILSGEGGEGGFLELSIEPRPIPFVKPLSVTVTFSGIDARKVDIDFSGRDMNMGYNRPPLVVESPNRFIGGATLPVCITGKMAWKATVLVENDQGQRIVAPFQFE
ncbi:MAG: hypothetical protein Q8O31_06680 [Rhodocyclaceae bacterium]|nr:hypothetical protein [Rhodocyclaceae bacterium]